MRYSRFAGVGLMAAVVTATTLAWPGSDGQQPTGNAGRQAPVVAAPGDQIQEQLKKAEPVNFEARQAQFRLSHPGNGVGYWQGDNRVYGASLGGGASPQAAAETVRFSKLPLFGVMPTDLQLRSTNPTLPLGYNTQTGEFKYTAVYYTQYKDGLEVYGTGLFMLAQNKPGHPVALMGGQLRDLGTFEVTNAMRNNVNEGMAFLEAKGKLGADCVFSPTREVIWGGVQGDSAFPRLALQFTAERVEAFTGLPKAWNVIADAATGEILFEEFIIHDLDVTGNVSGVATEGWFADACNPESPRGIPYAQVNIGATQAFADVNGNFTIPNAGTDPVTVEARLRGPFFVTNNTVSPGGGNTILSNVGVVPPGPTNFMFNSDNLSEFKRAEVNAYIHANVVRDYTLAHNPAYPIIGGEVNFPVNVNINQTCNAFYSPTAQTINFYIAGGGCTNTSNSTVVHHEYGHRLVNAAGSGQSSYGEGTGDTMAVIISDQPCLGGGFNTPCPGVAVPPEDGCLRSAALVPPCQYQTTGCSSCGGVGHACGQLISGCVWSVRNYLQVSNPATYRTILAELVTSSIPLHIPTSNTSITPAITVDYLTLDDTDGNILNGTPHYAEINGGFSDHNMPGPALVVGIFTTPAGGFTSSGLSGGPLTPNSINYTVENVEDIPLNYSVTVGQPWLTVTNGTGTIPANSTTVVTVALNAAANSLGNGLYTDTIQFTNLTTGQGNTTRPVNLEIGRVIYPGTGVPQTLPDLATITNTVNVGDNYCVGDVDVQVNVAHTSIGQLVVEVENPQGVIVRLHNRTGGTADNIVKTYSDGGATPPDGPGLLANFNGRGVQGAWKLRVKDEVSGTAGSLTSWSLRIVPSAAACAPIANNASVTVPILITSPVTLTGNSATGLPLTYSIDSLPANGNLFDPSSGLITTVPHLLPAAVVNYKPLPTHSGPDSFTFRVNDGLQSLPGTISVTVGGPQLVHNFPLNTNPGWAISGTSGNQWAFGVPQGLSGDPASGFTGTNVFGFNLAGDYVNSIAVEHTLTTGAINCSNLTGVQVKFQRWLGIEHASFDHARLKVSTNGTTFTTVWENPAGTGLSINESAWSLQSYNVPQADGQATVYFQWTLGTTDTSVVFHGWNIDDVQVWGVRPPCPADTNLDLVINVSDLLNVIANWGAAGGIADVAPPGGDGIVNTSDLLGVIAQWGSCP